MNRERVLIPRPQHAVFPEGDILLSEGGKPFYRFETVGCESPVYAQSVALLKKKLLEHGCFDDAESDYPICLNVNPDAFKEHAVADAYKLKISEAGACITGYDSGGVFCAVATFIQLLRTENTQVYVSQAEITDWPSFSTRSLFIENRYGSDFLTKKDWFDAIDYFASMKFNHLTVGVYGCWCQQFDAKLSEYLYIPFQKSDKLVTPRSIKYYSVAERKWIYKTNVLPVMFEDDYFGELIAYAGQRNIRVRPLFNSYGHNTLVPRMFPELSAKDADGNDTGFGVCTSDERTYEIMNDLYDEIIDRYLAPNGIDSIHLGLDEVWEGIGMDAEDPFRFHTPFCQCERCRARSHGEQMTDYIIRLCRHLKEKGMRSVYIYYDMLFNEFDVLNEDFVQKLKDNDVYDIVVVDWWDYSGEDRLFFGKEINSLFRSIIKPITGYFHWTAPMEYLGNLRGCARLALQHGYEGIEPYSSLEYSHDRSYWYTAELAWNASTIEQQPDFLRRYAAMRFPEAQEAALEALNALIPVMNDNFMSGIIKRNLMRKHNYYTYTYVRKDRPYPRIYPDELYETMDREEAVSYYTWVRSVTEKPAAFFEEQHRLGKADRLFSLTWLAIARHMNVIANEQLTLLALEKETDPAVALSTLEALLTAREALMLLAEETRIHATAITYLRILSIDRQVLLDLITYAKRCIRENTPFNLDLANVSGLISDTLRRLQ